MYLEIDSRGFRSRGPFGRRVKLVERLPLPEKLQGVFFDFLWNTEKCWQLPTAPSVVPIAQLVWLLDLPVWTTVSGEPRFDLAPSTVLAHPERFQGRCRRIVTVDLTYPLEMFRSHSGRWVILDGYHRLARHQMEQSDCVSVRLHPDRFKKQIFRD
jgi:hypothetical protein